MYEEEETRPPPQDWFVTFADMMALLLTFFIMLVSAADFRPEDNKKFKAVSAHVRRQAGDAHAMPLEPGELRPRDGKYARAAAQGRATRTPTALVRKSASVTLLTNLAPFGDSLPGPVAHEKLVGTMAFSPAKTELSEKHQRELVRLARESLGGTTGTIELRGRPDTSNSTQDEHTGDDAWRVAYQRVRRTRAFLLQLGIAPERVRVSVVQTGDRSEVTPEISRNQIATLKHGSVEVLLLNEGSFQTATFPTGLIPPRATSPSPTDLQQR